MADKVSERGARDRARININQPHELPYWAHKMGVTDGEKITAPCLEFDVSRKTGYKIFQRYKEDRSALIFLWAAA